MILEDYGFVEVGEWKLNENLKSGITFNLNNNFEEERVIYAFVVEGECKYLGCCDSSSTTLRIRMDRYKNLQGDRTNERIAKNIKDCLKSGKTVKIFALKPESILQLQYKDLKVDLVRGLEYPLIKKLNPEWNKAEM